MSDSVNSLTFLAALPPLKSAVMRATDGSGMVIKLEIPESEMGNAIRLQMWILRPLRFEIAVVETARANEAGVPKRKARQSAPRFTFEGSLPKGAMA